MNNNDLNLQENDKSKIHTFEQGVALNVTRTRITVLVFNLSIISFMLSMLKSSSGVNHLSTSVALFLGFCLTLLGLWLLLYSQTWDKLGLSRPMPFILGSMTTYLALSQTVTAFMHEYLLGLKTVFKAVPPEHVDYNTFVMLNETVIFILFTLGGLIWVLINYVAPLMVFARRKNPITIGRKWLLAGYYFAIQVPIHWIYAITWNIQYATKDQPINILQIYLLQFMQPILWWSQ